MTFCSKQDKFIAFRLLLVFFLAVITFTKVCFGQKDENFSLKQLSANHWEIHFKIDSFTVVSQTTSSGKYYFLSTKYGVNVPHKGLPSLPQYTLSLAIPNGATLNVKLKNRQFYIKKNIVIALSQEKHYRTQNQSPASFNLDKTYNQNTFYPKNIWSTRPSYFVHGQKGQSLIIHPFRYNAAKKYLEVNKEIVLDITCDFSQHKTSRQEKTTIQPNGFNSVYQQHFLNNPTQFKTITNNRIPREKMLIISYGAFIPLLKDFIVWKKKCGFSIQVVNADTLHTSKEVKSCIKRIYQQSNLIYVLLVGDADQVPPDSIAGHTADNAYTYLSGNDHYPDILLGRFAAETPEQLSIMLQRTLSYEKGNSSDTTFYANPTGIASDRGPGYQHLFDFQHIRFIDSLLKKEGKYHRATELFDGSQGPPDANGNPTKEMLINTINKGTGLINYCGHGSSFGWNTTGFGIAQIHKLNNQAEWPLIISVSCATGNFAHQQCFAENWLNASQNGKPTGAVAVLMPTIDQSWEPPMCGQQAINKLITNAGKTGYPQTFGKICMTGCMKMNDIFGSDGYEITDTWELFGDPSLIIRTKAPQLIRAEYPGTVAINTKKVTIKTSVQNGTVTLMSENKIYAISKTDSSGTCRLILDSIPLNKQADLTVTAFNHKAFFGKISWETTSHTQLQKQKTPTVSVFPNPAKTKVTLHISTPKNYFVRIRILDTKGTLIKKLFTGIISAGNHYFKWYPKTSGIYILQIDRKFFSLQRKIIITR